MALSEHQKEYLRLLLARGSINRVRRVTGISAIFTVLQQEKKLSMKTDILM